MTQEHSPNKFGRWFTWLAWFFFLAAITFAFDDFLTNKWQPNQELETSRSAEYAQVFLKQDPNGHYVAPGTINHSPAVFLLDTGATNVSIPEHLADNYALNRGRSYYVNTANGRVRVYQTMIEELRIGEIILYNVAAHINPGFKSNEILLGMSALKQIEFRQKGKNLTLIQTL